MVFPNLIPQVGAFSLDGKIHLCLMVDDAVVKEPQRLAHHLVADLAELAGQLKVPVPPELVPRP